MKFLSFMKFYVTIVIFLISRYKVCFFFFFHIYLFIIIFYL